MFRPVVFRVLGLGAEGKGTRAHRSTASPAAYPKNRIVLADGRGKTLQGLDEVPELFAPPV